MDTTISYVICTLILMLGSGIGGWYICKIAYKRRLLEMEWEVEQLQANYQLWLLAESDEPQYTPEVVGEHITEPEDIRATEGDLTWKQWQLENNIEPDDPLQDQPLYQQWREEQQKQCAKDIDRRIPGHGC